MDSGFSALILAGGRSSRLGFMDKALLPWEGKPVIVHLVERLGAHPHCGEVLVISGDEDRRARYAALLEGLEVSVWADLHPDRGPLGGLVTGLQHMEGEWGLAAACDMPLISAEVIELLWSGRAADEGVDVDVDVDIVVPEPEGCLMPTLALYHRRCLPELGERLRRDRLSLQGYIRCQAAHGRVRVIPQAALRAADPELRSFLNLNTPADWAGVGVSLEG